MTIRHSEDVLEKSKGPVIILFVLILHDGIASILKVIFKYFITNLQSSINYDITRPMITIFNINF